MALSGSITLITHTQTDDLEEITFTLPASMSEIDPYYAYRGQTISESVNRVEITSQSYDSAYVRIGFLNLYYTQYASWYIDADGTLHTSLAEAEASGTAPLTPTASVPQELMFDGTYHVYGNEASRSADPNNYLEESTIQLSWDPDIDTDPFNKAYTLLKTELGADTLTDV